MKLRYVVQRIGPGGTPEWRGLEYEQPTLCIGRGPGAEVDLESPLVSPAHAYLRLEGDDLVIEDLGGGGRVLVRGRPVRQAVLKAGDAVRLGDVTLRVGREEDAWVLFEKRLERARPEPTEGHRRTVRRLDLAHRLPSVGLLSGLVAAAVSLGLLAAPLLVPRRVMDRTPWSGGPLARAHRLLGGDCERCHGAPFRPFDERTCRGCHEPPEHASSVASASASGARPAKGCVDCHVEHRGPASLRPSEPAICAGCHARAAGPGAPVPVPDLARHPAFSPSQDRRNTRGAGPAPARDGAADPDSLRFSHRTHVDALRQGQEPPGATCARCHEAAKESRLRGGDLAPVTYRDHCAGCHSLTLEGSSAGVEVPHAAPGVVDAHVVAELARRHLGLGPPRGPGAAGPGPAASPVPAGLLGARIEEERLKVERELYTGTTFCDRCHLVTRVEETGPGSVGYRVRPPSIPERWLPASRFSHRAHRTFACERCHAAAPSSAAAGDFLLPTIDVCRGCHADPGTPGRLSSPCVTCHDYHQGSRK